MNNGDQHLERRIRNYLHDRGVAEWRSLGIESRGGIVVLEGRVASLAAWRLCLESCRRVAGVIRVVDELDVLMAEHANPVAQHSNDLATTGACR